MDLWFINRLCDQVLKPQGVSEIEIDDFKVKYAEYKAAQGTIKWTITSAEVREFWSLAHFVSKISGLSNKTTDPVSTSTADPSAKTENVEWLTSFPTVSGLSSDSFFVQAYHDEIYNNAHINVAMLDKLEEVFVNFNIAIRDPSNDHILYEYARAGSSDKTRMYATVYRDTDPNGKVTHYLAVPTPM